MIGWVNNVYATDRADQVNLVGEYDTDEDDRVVLDEDDRIRIFLFEVIVGFFFLLIVFAVNLFVLAQMRKQAGCSNSNQVRDGTNERNET